MLKLLSYVFVTHEEDYRKLRDDEGKIRKRTFYDSELIKEIRLKAIVEYENEGKILTAHIGFVMASLRKGEKENEYNKVKKKMNNKKYIERKLIEFLDRS